MKSGIFGEKFRKQSQSLLLFNYLEVLLTCCWAVAAAFPGVCLPNHEAWRNWDEFFMIFYDQAEDTCGDFFLILLVFTNRMELGSLGHEILQI